MAWSSSGGRKWIVSSEWTEINSVFVSRHRNRLDIRVGIEIDLISVIGSKSSCFSCGGSSLTWFQFRYRIDLVFHEGDLVYCVSGRNWSDFSAGDRSWLDFRLGMKLMGYCVGGRNCLDFSVGDRNWLDFSVEIGNGAVFERRSKMNCFKWMNCN